MSHFAIEKNNRLYVDICSRDNCPVCSLIMCEHIDIGSVEECEFSLNLIEFAIDKTLNIVKSKILSREIEYFIRRHMGKVQFELSSFIFDINLVSMCYGLILNTKNPLLNCSLNVLLNYYNTYINLHDDDSTIEITNSIKQIITYIVHNCLICTEDDAYIIKEYDCISLHKINKYIEYRQKTYADENAYIYMLIKYQRENNMSISEIFKYILNLDSDKQNKFVDIIVNDKMYDDFKLIWKSKILIDAYSMLNIIFKNNDTEFIDLLASINFDFEDIEYSELHPNTRMIKYIKRKVKLA